MRRQAVREIVALGMMLIVIALLVAAWAEQLPETPVEKPKYEDPEAVVETRLVEETAPLHLFESTELFSTLDMAQTMTFGHDAVVLDLRTGQVTLKPGVTPDEGARAFWAGVEALATQTIVAGCPQ